MAAVAAARETEDARLIFFTWNTQLTVGAGQVAPAPDARLWTNAELRDARAVDLQIVQVHGKKLRMLQQITGARNYNLFDYHANGPPTVSLPGCDK